VTGYLAALAARELPPTAATASADQARPWVVTPRRVAPYEAWVMPAVTDIETAAMLPPTAAAPAIEPGKGERLWGSERVLEEAVRPVPTAPPGAPVPRPFDEARPRPALVPHGHEAGPHQGGTLAPAASSVTVPPSSASPVEQQRRFDPPAPMPLDTGPAPPAVRESVLPAESRAIPQLRVLPAPRTPAPVMPRRSAVQAERPVRPHAPAPREATPPVVVTIGRIEVRAIPAPPAARAVRDTPPAMSLDDYLRERTRGLR
jgi:hypothetical protein